MNNKEMSREGWAMILAIGSVEVGFFRPFSV